MFFCKVCSALQYLQHGVPHMSLAQNYYFYIVGPSRATFDAPFRQTKSLEKFRKKSWVILMVRNNHGARPSFPSQKSVIWGHPMHVAK